MESKNTYKNVGSESPKKKKHDTLIIIPAYNEEENLQGVFDSLMEAKTTDYADILVINDASKDGTPYIADRNNIRCISFPFNLGYGNALQAGYKYAKDHLYDYIIQMDADGQHDVSNVYNIYQALCLSPDHPDIVLSCRFMEDSKHYETGFFMKLAHQWLRFLMKLFSGIYFPDSTTGLQGLSRAAFEYYAGYDNFDAMYPDAHMILKMHFLGFKIKQIPSVMHKRTSGKSMHSGIIRPIKYMVRITTSVIAIWLSMVHLKKSHK
ncbi:MAG: glycosyltransferase family 2 protein [Lachnospiraceae bacterium]|nr:glycosyltransferase family 2 protein [Lachnospiraceae bacterium]